MTISWQDHVDLIRRYRYESVERVECHLDQQVDLPGYVSKRVQRFPLPKLAAPAARIHLCRELNAVKWSDDVDPINRRPRDAHPIGHMKSRAL